MKLLRAATLSVADPVATAARYTQWLDYQVVDAGTVSADLAASWGSAASAGRHMVVMQPASGAPVFLRFIAGDPVPTYRPLRSFGWAALEICVQDVQRVNERMQQSPFAIIGPPKPLPGMPMIHPMQVQGPDGEIIYLTQIDSDLPDQDLPRAESLIDRLFILVMAASDLKNSLAWFRDVIGLSHGTPFAIPYTMISKAFDLPLDTKHTLCTMTDGRDVFLELDQLPAEATRRPRHEGQLPPGIALCTLLHRDLSSIKADWITSPVRRDDPIYDGRLTGTLRAPDGTLVELVQVG